MGFCPMKVSKDDPFPTIPRRQLYRDVEPGAPAWATKATVQVAPPLPPEPEPEPDPIAPPPKIEVAKAALVEGEAKASRGGRPPKYVGVKPWELERISKASWYKKKRKAAAP